jgi:hypothetical protein
VEAAIDGGEAGGCCVDGCWAESAMPSVTSAADSVTNVDEFGMGTGQYA